MNSVTTLIQGIITKCIPLIQPVEEDALACADSFRGRDELIRPRRFLSPLAVWVVMAVIAIVNGGFREVVLIPRLGEYAGHVASTASLVLLIAAIAFFYFRTTTHDYSRGELVVVAIAWTILTVGFEFLIGDIEGTPVAETLAQYNVVAGQVWIAVPLTLLLSPLLFGYYLSS